VSLARPPGSFIGVIPARGGSKGIPGKNIAPLAGKPLISYMIRAALESGALDALAVSSDDQNILDVAAAYGEGKLRLIKRPAELAGDTTPSLPVVRHAVELLEAERGGACDYVVMFQCTTPLATAEDIAGALGLLAGSGADAVMTVFKTNESHPAKAKKLAADGRLTQYVEGLAENQFTRQALAPVYRRNGAVYASRRDVVIRDGKLYGGDDIVTLGYVMPEERSVDINNPLDLLVAEAILRLRNNTGS
jgi:CMP-N,N'-diacetyllegionaminic acid synthase